MPSWHRLVEAGLRAGQGLHGRQQEQRQGECDARKGHLAACALQQGLLQSGRPLAHPPTHHPPAQGAEYAVLPSLILSGALCEVNVAFIEWHGKDLKAKNGLGALDGGGWGGLMRRQLGGGTLLTRAVVCPRLRPARLRHGRFVAPRLRAWRSRTPELPPSLRSRACGRGGLLQWSIHPPLVHPNSRSPHFHHHSRGQEVDAQDREATTNGGSRLPHAAVGAGRRDVRRRPEHPTGRRRAVTRSVDGVGICVEGGAS